MQKPPKSTDGFSLIELSIVMAVMSVMATALVPNLLAQHQDKLVEATVETYYRLGDAAMAYRQANGDWPGAPTPGAGDGNDCIAGATDPIADLVSEISAQHKKTSVSKIQDAHHTKN